MNISQKEQQNHSGLKIVDVEGEIEDGVAEVMDEKVKEHFTKEAKEEEIDSLSDNSRDKKETPKHTINFLEDDLSASMMGAKTEQSRDVFDEGEEFEDEEQDRLREKFDPRYAPVEDELLEEENFGDIAEFFMEGFDTIFSFGCGYAAGEKSNNFEIPVHKKKKLQKQLAKILEKRQVKMNIEMVFLMSLVIVYSDPIKKVVETRNKKSNKPLNENRSDDTGKAGIQSPVENRGPGRPSTNKKG